jgi:single-strand DNA-binding protein
MSRGINKVIVIGTVGKDPEIRYFQSGDAYCTLSVATSESWKDKNGEKQEKTEWHRVKFTRKLAEIVGEYVKKGALIYVEGKLETTKYTDKQGVERYATDIVANQMQMLGGKKQEQSDGFSTPKPSKPAANTTAANTPAPSADPFEDDVPFN